MFETFEHTADVGLRVTAPTLEELFAESARALTAQIVDNPEEIRAVEAVAVQKTADATDYLLFDWLSELIYLYECRRLIGARFDITLSDGRLDAVVHGETVDPERHSLSHDVKAVTYHEFKIEQTETGYQARIILDI